METTRYLDPQPENPSPETMEVTDSNVHEIEHLLMEVLPPMRQPTDILLQKYFKYLIQQMQKITDVASLRFPFFYYDEQVQNIDELKIKHRKLQEAIPKIIEARGRNDCSRIGDHFWTNSKVQTLFSIFHQLARETQRVYPLLR